MMASVLFLESFDVWDQATPRVKWPIANDPNNMSVSALYGRNGGGIQMRTGGATVFTTAGQNSGTPASDSAMLEYANMPFVPVSVGLAFRVSDLEIYDDIPIVAWIDSGTIKVNLGTFYGTQSAIYYCQDQRLRIYRGEFNARTLIADLGVVCRRNVFHYIEATLTVSTSGSIQAWFDGKLVLDGTYNTQALTTSATTGMRFFSHRSNITFGGNVRNYNVDDIYVSSGARLMDLEVETTRPNADGFHSAWSPSSGLTHYNLVDDTVPDGDSTYVTAGAAGNTDTYEITSLSNGTGLIHGLQIGVDHYNSLFDVATLSTVLRQSGTDATGASQQMGTIEYRYLLEGLLENPVTTAPFTVSEVNSDIQIGMRRNS